MEPTAAISQEWALFETRAKALLELLDIAISSTNALHSQLEGSRAQYERREARKLAAKARKAASARVSGRVRRKRGRSRSAAG